MNPDMRMTPGNLRKALAAYAILAIAAGLVIKGDLRVRIVLWVLFAGLALKSLAAYKLQDNPPRDLPDEEQPEPGEDET